MAFSTASLYLMCSMTSSSSTSYLMCSMTTLSRTLYLMCSMTTSSSTSSFPSLMSSMSCKSKKPRKVRQKKKKKWGWQLSSWQMFFFGGGKCLNLGVVNVRILGVVNVRLANNLTPFWRSVANSKILASNTNIIYPVQVSKGLKTFWKICSK